MSSPSQVSKPQLPIGLLPVAPADLFTIADVQFSAFGDELYGILEPPALRPAHPTRIARTAARTLPILHSPLIKFTKAVKSATGEIVGVAMWHRPGAPLYNLQRKGEGEQGEMWDGVDEKAWNGFFGSADEKRKEIMGDEPHWRYLGPLWVLPAYQGQGVGSALVREVVALADAATPPVAIFLEASKAGVPVYRKLGFDFCSEGSQKEMLRKAGLR